MKIKQLKNENGLTLIEVLASLSIFAILLVLSSTLLIQLGNSEEISSDSISLQQDTNVLMAEIRNQYQKSNSSICLGKKSSVIVSESTTIKNGTDVLTINDGCIDHVNPKKDLDIHLTTSNGSGNSFSVETTLSKKDEYVLNLETTNENVNDFKEGNINDCDFKENVKFTDYIKTKNGNPGCNQYNFHKSVAFLDGIKFQNHASVVVKKNLYVKNELTVQPHTQIMVESDFHMEGTLDVKGELCIKGEFKNKQNYTADVYEASECFKPAGYHIYLLNK